MSNRLQTIFLSALVLHGAVAMHVAAAAAATTTQAAGWTHHRLATGSGALEYRATATTLPLKDDAGKTKAQVFHVAYEKLPASPPAQRPVTFVFNGGPGAASVWLHLGAVGPQVIELGADGQVPPPPHRLTDNPHTWLAFTDLVFIDPVGTGFSRPAAGEKAEQFFGVQEDIQWVAEFIRLYLTRAGRWASPKFLAGESYGTTRAAGLAAHLQDRHGIAVNGLVLISSVLDFQTIRIGGGNDLPYALFLPTYTAVAAHHGKLADDLRRNLPQTLKEVERWALEQYVPALAKGDSLEPEARRAVAGRLSRYAGMPLEWVEKANLRIDPGAFQNRLLEDQRRVVGRFDGRVTGFAAEPLAARASYDPSLSRYLPVYSGTFNDYVRRQLGYESELPYEVLSGNVHPWNFGQNGHGFLSVSDDLRLAMVKNPHLKVLFCSGIYDLATPYLATDYTIWHLDLGRELRKNISHTYYDGGHMMYHQRQALQKLAEDVGELIRR